MVGDGDRMETGSYGSRRPASPMSAISTRRNWKEQVDEALRQALVNLGSVPAPAGEMTVVLGPGWPGRHAARGGRARARRRFQPQEDLGLFRPDGPARRDQGVTVVDDGTIPDRRGSLTVDDEGTPIGTAPC